MSEVLTVTLEWNGPFTEPSTLPSESGLYAMSARVYGGSNVQLLYVGLAKGTIRDRWTCQKHRSWLKRSVQLFGAELYYAACESQLLDDVESALIYIHQPNQNSSKKNAMRLARRYIIHNTLVVPPGMLPVIDTAYPWFGSMSAPAAALSAQRSPLSPEAEIDSSAPSTGDHVASA